MYTKIAVATDGSAMGGKAVNAAARLAVLCQSELVVLHVLMHGEPPESLVHMAEVEHLVKDNPQFQAALDNIPSQMIGVTAEIARRRLDDAAIARMGDTVIDRAVATAKSAGVQTVTREVLSGDTAQQIIDAANRHGVDLITVGTRGLGPIKGLVMGSVSQKISQHADCDCLVIR